MRTKSYLRLIESSLKGLNQQKLCSRVANSDDRSDCSTDNAMSQPILIKEEDYEDSDEDWSRPSTQEINAAQTQEASNASDFFDHLTASQISRASTTSSPTSSQTDYSTTSQSIRSQALSQYLIALPFGYCFYGLM